MTAAERVKRAAGFDQEFTVRNATALVERFKQYPSESELFRRMEQIAREENGRLAPLISALTEIAELIFAEECPITQSLAYKKCKCLRCGRLNALEKLLPEEKAVVPRP